MNRPARRDGTPDRNRHRRADGPRRGAERREGPRTGRTDPGAGRPRKADGNGRTGRPDGSSRTDRSGGAGRTGRPDGSGRKNPRGGAGADAQRRRNPGQQPRDGRPAPAKRRPTTLSFARPARNQSDGPVATSFRSGREQGEGVRLQKVLAQAGVASRRASEILIDQGRVEVDGRIVTRQGMRIDPTESVVRVDGVRIVIDDAMVYLALNKPRGWQSTMSDDLGRPCIGDIVAERVMAGQHIFHVGRLDAETEGLILLTNDGELSHRLMHPSYRILKTYLATLDGRIPRNLGRTLSEGIELDDGPVRVDRFSVVELGEQRTLVRVVLHEGRKHIVRRMFEEVGNPVIDLVRTDVGPVSLGDQRPGTLRVLGRGEVAALYEAVGL